MLQEHHYYPFGMEWGPYYGNAVVEGPWQWHTTETPEDEHRYRYNGIEWEKGSQLLMATFRSYDPVIGRWLQVDPIAEAAYSWSPYRFGFNNPLYYFDPDGLFESRGEARKYKRAEGVKGRISRNKDSNGNITYSIDDKNSGTSTTYIDGIGIVKSNIMVTASHMRRSRNNEMSIGGGINWDKEVSFGEGMVPIWGSLRMSVRDFQAGDYGWGVFNAAMAVSDIFLAKSIVSGIGKLTAGTLWKSGSHTWSATRRWYGRNGLAEKG